MKTTYRAMQASQPGVLELVERQTPEPGDGEVLIEVEACGICGADTSDIEGADLSLQPPRVPGHEVVGRIVALGKNSPSRWKLGQRVGVGRLDLDHSHAGRPWPRFAPSHESAGHRDRILGVALQLAATGLLAR